MKGKARGWKYYTLQFTSELFLFLHYTEKSCLLLNHWSLFSPKHPTGKLDHPQPSQEHDLGFQSQRLQAQHHRALVLSVIAPAEMLSGSAAAQQPHLPRERLGWPGYSAETEFQTSLWLIPIPLPWQGRMKGKAGSRDSLVKVKRF